MNQLVIQALFEKMRKPALGKLDLDWEANASNYEEGGRIKEAAPKPLQQEIYAGMQGHLTRLRAGGRGPQRAAPRDGARAPEDVEKQPATEFRVLQDNADKFQHKDLTDRRRRWRMRAPSSADERGNPQNGDVQQLGAVDSMTVRSTEGRETC